MLDYMNDEYDNVTEFYTNYKGWGEYGCGVDGGGWVWCFEVAN